MVCLYVIVSVCVCVCEREREREKPANIQNMVIYDLYSVADCVKLCENLIVMHLCTI